MPRRPPRCTSGDKQDDCKGRIVHLLARDDQGHSRHKRQLHHLQWHRPIPTSHALHHPGDASIPLPTCMWRLLSPHGHILPGPGGQIFTLAHRHPHPGKEPRDSSIPCGTPLPLTGSQTPSHLTGDQSLRHTSLDPSSKTGTCATGSHQPTIPTPTAGRR